MDLIKALLLGIVQGITEWLPISSTGHMILIDEIIHLNVSESFMQLFLVVVQLGSIMAVVVLYYKNLVPFDKKEGWEWNVAKINLWKKIIIGSIPAGIIGVIWGEKLNDMFLNSNIVGVMLIVVGIIFLIVERWKKNFTPTINRIEKISYRSAFFIGLCQLLAAVFPGTSRSGATIIGALIIGIARPVAAEFTFYLAIPAMAGASLLKILKFKGLFTTTEIAVLGIGTISAFVFSIICIKFLMNYIKKHDFTVFGWYRIVLGILVICILN